MQLNLFDDRFVDVEIGDSSVRVKILPSSRVASMAKKNTRTVVRKGVPVEDFDARGFAREFWGETVMSWSGFTDLAGNDIPCTPENAFQVVDRHSEIGDKIREAIEAAKAALVDSAEADRKN